jgi:hypothetical protein
VVIRPKLEYIFSNKILIINILHKYIKIIEGVGHLSKLINIKQNLFFYVAAICNLAIEFNGLVSTKDQQKC